jgi:hypothetical protein
MRSAMHHALVPRGKRPDMPGETEAIGLRVPKDLSKRIDDEIELLAAREGIRITRSQMVRVLLEEALGVRDGRRRKK